MDVFPRLLESDVPFYSHEIEAYWNDIGNLEELRGATSTRSQGAVAVEREGEVVDGFRSGSPAQARGRVCSARSCSGRAARSARTSASMARR